MNTSTVILSTKSITTSEAVESTVELRELINVELLSIGGGDGVPSFH